MQIKLNALKNTESVGVIFSLSKVMNNRMNYEMINENIPFGVILHNSEGLIIDANKQVEQILTINLNEVIGKKWDNLPFKIINRKGVEYSVNEHSVTKTLKAGKGIKDQIVGILYPENKKVVWININTVFKSADLNQDSDQGQVLMYLSDITDIIKTTVTIEKVIENLNLGTWQWNIQTGKLKFNEQWAKMMGYTLEELPGSNIDVWYKLIHPDDFKIMEDSLFAHFEGRSPEYHCEIRLLHKSGHWVWVRHIGKVTLRSDEGRPLFMSGIHQNISDYKTTELNLKWKVQYEKVLSQIASKFISTNNIDATIIESFDMLASLNNASRVYLFMLNAEKGTMSNTHEWCSEGVSAQKDILQDLALTDFSWWIKKLSNGEVINISDVSKMVIEAKAEREILEYQGVKSILVLPIIIKQSLIGFIGFDNVDSSEKWSEDDIDLLLTTASLFSYALDRQLSEIELNKSYLNLRAYFDLNSDFVMILNEQAEIIEVNNTVKEKLGYDNEDIIGKHALMLHPSDIQEEAANIMQTMIEGKATSCPLPVLTKNGEKILVETSLTKGVWDGESAFFVMSKDISKRAFSEEKFDKIFHNIPTIATLSDLETGKYIEVNSVFYDKLGFSMSEAIGSNAIELLGMDADICSQISKDLADKGFIRNIETVIYHKNGTPIHVLVSATSIYLLDKKYSLTLASDITETKKNQLQLIEAKTKAEESDRLKSAFLATMNHELRSPLNHIIGFSDMIPSMTEDPNIKEFSRLIHSSGLNLLSIIEDIFDLAMLDQSKIDLRKESLYIRDIYSEMCKLLHEALSQSNKEKNILLDCNINTNATSRIIVTDMSKVMQVGSNLINNAIKFTHQGVISLDFSIVKGDILSISIKDTGIGIPKDKQDIIFEFFRQVDDSHTRNYEGIGIGLALSQKIANALGGEISLKSESGVGSEFVFTFPVKFQEEELKDTEEEFARFPAPDLSGKKILIAEDDQVGMEMIVNMISPTKCEIIKAVDGYEALVKVLEDPTIELVLMDLKMPLMDGFEATKQIRKKLPYLPILALTAYSMQKDKLKALDAGCNDLLTKPVNKTLLMKKLQDILTK